MIDLRNVGAGASFPSFSFPRSVIVGMQFPTVGRRLIARGRIDRLLVLGRKAAPAFLATADAAQSHCLGHTDTFAY